MTSANKQPFVAREKLKDEEVGCGMQRVEGKVGNKKIPPFLTGNCFFYLSQTHPYIRVGPILGSVDAVYILKDGNGAPIPDTRRVFVSLGDGDGIISLLAGI